MNGCATAPDWSKEPYPVKKQNFAHNANISADVVQPAVAESVDINQTAQIEEPATEQLTGADAENETEAVPEEGPSPPESVESAETIAGTDSPIAANTEENSVVLQPYDTVRFRFLYWPELDDEQVIRPDGKISLLMVGDVEAEGKTPASLQAELTKLYEPLLKEPEINVAVSSLASNRAYVFGSVLTPGMILLEGKLTLLSAIAQAGGFIEERANKSMIVVVRDINGEQFARSINLKDALKNPQSDTFYIEPYDIVYVPETTIVKMNQFVAQYIDGLIPNHISFGASYSLGGKSTRVSTSNNAAWQKLPALNFSTGK
jgi:protein involved in polysaccharide export with SLBB domain